MLLLRSFILSFCLFFSRCDGSVVICHSHSHSSNNASSRKHRVCKLAQRLKRGCDMKKNYKSRYLETSGPPRSLKHFCRIAEALIMISLFVFACVAVELIARDPELREDRTGERQAWKSQRELQLQVREQNMNGRLWRLCPSADDIQYDISCSVCLHLWVRRIVLVLVLFHVALHRASGTIYNLQVAKWI